MKRLFFLFIMISLCLSACVLDSQFLTPITIGSVTHLDGELLSLVLENALKSYKVFVNGVEFSCEFLESNPELLRCIGPEIAPGEEIVIEIYQPGEGGAPVSALKGTLPDYPSEPVDSDQDGVLDSEDECPLDPAKSDPGSCGCGLPDTDSDGDGEPDCDLACQDGRADGVGDPCNHDEDGDGTDDFGDECPFDPAKTNPGECGCGNADNDTDQDGTPDCDDRCPENPEKIKPGECGCREADLDSDGDGKLDCDDVCPFKPGPSSNGGCPEAADEDEDGVPDHEDDCPEVWGSRPNGCPVEDTDEDGVPDHEDDCPEVWGSRPNGCPEEDTDEDGVPDHEDECPLIPGPVDGCPDADGDGVMDCKDDCPEEWGELPNGCPEEPE